jgi:hypothetical protein
LLLRAEAEGRPCEALIPIDGYMGPIEMQCPECRAHALVLVCKCASYVWTPACERASAAAVSVNEELLTGSEKIGHAHCHLFLIRTAI